MAIYTGAKCLICSEKFKDEDDIVVCPECGTPYHRACYKEQKCINKELHESGGSWMLQTIEGTKKVPEIKICPNCQSLNTGDAEECSVCGKSMKVRTLPKASDEQPEDEEPKEEKAAEEETDRHMEVEDEIFLKIGQDPEEVMDEESGVTCREISEYVRNIWFRYLLKFKKLKNSTVEITTNFTAFFFPEYYFAGRKMYPQAVIVLLLNFLASVPAHISSDPKIFQWYPLYPTSPWIPFVNFDFKTDPLLLNLGFALSICIRIICCLKADDLYFNDIIKKIKKLKLKYTDETVYRTKVKEAGGVSIGAVLIIFFSALFLYALLDTVLVAVSVL